MLQRLPQRGPNPGWSAESFAALGMECARRGELPAALRLLHRSIEHDSDCYQAWLGLFEIFMAIHEPRLAARSLRIARQLRSRGPHGGSAPSITGSAIA